jgi:hypothetical protein
MSVGDPPIAVPSDDEYNNPTPRSVLDDQQRVADRLTVLERATS